MRNGGLPVEKEKLKELIVSQKERFLARKGLVPRDVLREITNYLPQREMIILTGVRRSGKSSLMRLICDDLLVRDSVPENSILYVNFEDERFINFTVDDFETLYDSYLELENPQGRKYLFLDEIQNVKGWERWLNRLYEFEDIKIFVTGSNAAMLSSEIATALTGRNRQIVNWPFSFREFLIMRDELPDGKALYRKEVKHGVIRLFSQYLELGGFPEVLKSNETSILEQYYRDILYRDVIARHGIRNVVEIKELALFLASNPATVQSYKNMKMLIGVKSLSTVKTYLDVLNDVYLFLNLGLFDYSVKRQIYNPSKIFCIDTGLCNAVSFRFSRNSGHLLENLVCVELLRRRAELYYWKSAKGREVDFVMRRGSDIEQAIQVSHSLADDKTRERELRALLDAREELKAEKLTVITEDEEGSIIRDGVTVEIVPAWKWSMRG